MGDCKYLWEPNRHLHLVTLAQAYALTGDVKYAATLRRHLESWIEACPFRMGANWASSLEAGLRLTNWSLAWQLLGGVRSPLFDGAEGEAFRGRWLESVYQHAEFVAGHFSLHSSANNHLIGEASGLYLGAMAWPHWPRARQWREAAREILEREALLQNAPDGVNREQATSYLQFTFDLLLLPLLAARANGDDFPAPYRERLENMLVFLASIMDAGGNVPMFGDADDAYVAKLDPREGFCRYKSLLATGALLFDRGDLKAKAGALDDKTRWLLGEGADGALRAARGCRGRPADPPRLSRGRLLRARLRLRGGKTRSASSPMPVPWAIARSPPTATPMRCRSRSRWAGSRCSSIRAPTRTTRSRIGAPTSAAPRRTTRCAWTGATSRSPAAISCGCARRTRAASRGPRPRARIASRDATTAMPRSRTR